MNTRTRAALLDHLTQYKRTVLGVQEDGLEKKWNTPRTYILPEELLALNLLERSRGVLDNYSFKLHRGFHHLNSSQALCLNLFHPLMITGRLHLFMRYIGLPDNHEPHGKFEQESSRESVGEGEFRTSFDLHVTSDGMPEVCVEVKYTEPGFGTGRQGSKKKLAERRHKIEGMYRGLVALSPYFADKQMCSDTEFWLTNYQLMRNLVHIDTNSHLVLAFPSWNTNIRREADYATTLLTPDGQARLHIVELEPLVEFLGSNVADNEKMVEHYAEFRRKYLPDLGNVT